MMLMMKMKILHILCFVLLLLQFAEFETGNCRLLDEENHLLGGVHDHYYYKGFQNDAAEIESIGRYAVEEHNKKENSLLEFARVINAKEQVVAGKMYHLTLEAIDAGKKKIYEAKVWVKPWMNFKQLQEFKHADDVPSFTPSDLNAK